MNAYPRSLIRREWLAALCASSAVFAAVTTVVSAQPPQRSWGMFATVGYSAACLATLAVRHHGARLAVLAALGGAVVAPLTWMAVAGQAQPEIGVITRSAALFLHHGTPYLGTTALAAAHNPYTYDPYLPALMVFGMPHALFGEGLLADPRVWFGTVFAATFGAALAVAGRHRVGWWAAAVIATPLIAFPLSVGGDDLPVLGLLCLGLAVAGADAGPRSWWRRPWRQPVAAGLILGLAAAMKATAWPALAVALALLGARQGKRGAAMFGLAAAGIAVISAGPAIAVAPGAMVVNTIAYPLGLAKAASPAASALPGHLIAATGSTGRWAAISLVVIAGLAVAIWLLIRPPADVHTAGWRLVTGLTLLFLLAPASRAGYFIYPLGLSAWLLLTRPSRTRPADETSHGRTLTPTARSRGHEPTPVALPLRSASNGVARPAYSATSRG